MRFTIVQSLSVYRNIETPFVAMHIRVYENHSPKSGDDTHAGANVGNFYALILRKISHTWVQPIYKIVLSRHFYSAIIIIYNECDHAPRVITLTRVLSVKVQGNMSRSISIPDLQIATCNTA